MDEEIKHSTTESEAVALHRPCSALYAEFFTLLGNPKTSLDDIEAAGWRFEANEGGVFWRHTQTRAVCSIPLWARQWATKKAANARATLHQQMREVLGL